MPSNSGFKKNLVFFAVFLGLFLLASEACVFGLEQLHITFDPPLNPYWGNPLTEWFEQGMYFTGPHAFQQWDSGKDRRPDNGTAYLAFAMGPPQTITFSFLDLTPFALNSVDIAEYSTLFVAPKTVEFVCHKIDDTVITANFTTDGLIDGPGGILDFETFVFGPEFTEINHVEVPTTTYTMDNIVFTKLPGYETLIGFQIVGPNNVVEMTTAHYNAIAFFESGYTLNVTSAATCTWSLDPNMYASIDDTGLLTAEDIDVPEDITIYAQYSTGGVTLEAELSAQISLHIPRTLHVPEEYDTIQAAIDDANAGDEIILADGTYTGDGNRNIDFFSKAITVRSENGPNNCIIDCEHNGRGFNFQNGETLSSILEGITICNGNEYEGSCIYIANSSPRILNCLFKDNSRFNGKGAIFCDNSGAEIIDCVFKNNNMENGSGIKCEDGGDVKIRGCEFYGGGDSAIYCEYDVRVTVKNCIIMDTNGTAAYHAPPAIYLVEIDNASIIHNCIIANNYSTRWSAGIWCIRCAPTVTNCTIVGNQSDNGPGGGIGCYDADPVISNCIIWGNEPPDGPQIVLKAGSNPSISYCDIQGGWLGKGNIDTDPCFVDVDSNDFHLSLHSLCINAGDPNYIAEPNETDLDGLPRVIGGRIDIGAYEFNHQPVAVVGPNQIAYASIDGFADVNLDGSGSYDDDNDVLDYYWSWTIDSNDYEANGVSPTISLPVGEHTIELVVDDGIDESEPNYCTIEAIAPLQVRLFCIPCTLYQKAWYPKSVLAMISMPPGIHKADINLTESLIFYPGQIESKYQFAFEVGPRRYRHTYVWASFYKSECIQHLKPGFNRVNVVGKLTSGRYYDAAGYLRLVPAKWHRWPH